LVTPLTRKERDPPDKGELAAIRFKASTEDGKVIDDIFETPEPYYTRVGLGGMLPGVEGALPYMKLGDRWTLTIPVCILQCSMCVSCGWTLTIAVCILQCSMCVSCVKCSD
jgi:hypothetical protein